MIQFDPFSLDGAISAAVSAMALWILVLQVIHDLKFLKEKYEETPIIGYLIDKAEFQREKTLRIIKRAYELRFVTLFILMAMFVSTISPASSLLEVEDGIVQKSCNNLIRAEGVLQGVDLKKCIAMSASGEDSYFNRSMEVTKSHFVQIALWPLAATLYGFGLSLFVRVVRRDETQPLEEVIELFPHVHHLFMILTVGVFSLLSWIQNSIGS